MALPRKQLACLAVLIAVTVVLVAAASIAA
jgi:hypothetical protein